MLSSRHVPLAASTRPAQVTPVSETGAFLVTPRGSEIGAPHQICTDTVQFLRLVPLLLGYWRIERIFLRFVKRQNDHNSRQKPMTAWILSKKSCCDFPSRMSILLRSRNGLHGWNRTSGLSVRSRMLCLPSYAELKLVPTSGLAPESRV